MKKAKEQITLWVLKMLLSSFSANTMKLSVMIKGQKNAYIVSNVSSQTWGDEILLIFESMQKDEYIKPQKANKMF